MAVLVSFVKNFLDVDEILEANFYLGVSIVYGLNETLFFLKTGEHWLRLS